jgi:hypothetical protein
MGEDFAFAGRSHRGARRQRVSRLTAREQGDDRHHRHDVEGDLQPRHRQQQHDGLRQHFDAPQHEHARQRIRAAGHESRCPLLLLSWLLLKGWKHRCWRR